MNNLIRFTVIFFVLIAAGLSVLAVGGVLSSEQLWNNLVKVAELVGILFVASALVMLLTKSK